MNTPDNWYAVGIVAGLFALIVLAIWTLLPANKHPRRRDPGARLRASMLLRRAER